MGWIESLTRERAILAEGAVIERLRRDPAVRLDPLILNSSLLFDAHDRALMETIYREYVDIGARYDLPLVLCTPTWRANPERIRLSSTLSCEEVNREAAGFLREIRGSRGSYATRVFIAGLLGCRGDAYAPRESLSATEAREFHGPQARFLAAAGADFLLAATLPSAPEALGMAQAMSGRGLPYVVSFVLRPNGSLLDGTALHEAIRAIDRAADPPPCCYWANCTYPAVFASALDVLRRRDPAALARVLGLQANSSPLPPERLDGSPHLLGRDPEELADQMAGVLREYGTKVLGGCCGTDGRHVEAIAQRIGRS